MSKPVSPWVLFYADGSRITSAQVAPADTPTEGVVFAAHPRSENGNLVYPGDWVVYHDGFWYGHDLPSLLRLMVHRLPSIEAVRQGVFVEEDRYWAMHSEACSPKLFEGWI